MNYSEKKEITMLLRELEIRNAKKSFWLFCKCMAPDFYLDNRYHLKLLCDDLQKLYEGKLLKPDGTPFKKFMLNMPPQHGKSRTLVNFCDWVFGQNLNEKIITCSYNDLTASDFSRYTRDGIMQRKNNEEDIDYSDIFPLTKIKDGNAGFEKWALEGQHFSYLGAGVGGSITSKGGSILIVDDPIKDAETAFNEGALDKIWRWYTSTFLSRVSAPSGEPIEIVNMTIWSKNDICGRILTGPEADDWYTILFEAYNEVTDKMLCPELLSYKRYCSQRTNMDDAIFRANYHQEPVDIQGRLYQDLKEYNDFPKDDKGNILFESLISYTDTADTGADNLCSIVGGVYKGEIWVLDIYYTNEAMEVTEPGTADFLVGNLIGGHSIKAKIESNNGGRGFARNVDKLIWDRHKTRKVNVEWFHQSENKVARILTNASYITNHMFFPKGWSYKYSEAYKHVASYQKVGKNKHDDIEDVLTGLAEMVNSGATGWMDFLKDAQEEIGKREEIRNNVIPFTRSG
jgi:predicted phage terminase large subunit-like protein